MKMNIDLSIELTPLLKALQYAGLFFISIIERSRVFV